MADMYTPDIGYSSAFDDDTTPVMLRGLISPADAHSLVMPPPDSAPKTSAGQTTPQTGSIATAPSQAQPKVSGPAMIPRVAAKPENLMGGMPSLPAAAQPSVVPDRLNMRTQQDQAKLAQLQDAPAGGSQIQNRWGRIAAGIGDVALSALAPNIAQYVPQTTLNKQRQVGIQQGVVNQDQSQQQARAQMEDTASQTAERNALSAKATALAGADATFNLSKEQAEAIHHPELEGQPMTQRVYGGLAGATIKGDAQQATGASHDATKVTTTGMNNATSRANNAAGNTSREAISNARDKTQRILGELRASVSTANNERTNATHETTAGMRASGSANGQPGTFKVPADVTKRAALADNVQENAGEISKILDDNPDIVGKIAGRFTNAEQMTGNDDPAIQALGVRIHNIALASNGAHGVRSAEAVAKTEQELLNNFHNGPNAIKGALNATTTSVQTFLNDEKNFRQTGGRVAPAPTSNSQPQVDPQRLRPSKDAPLGSVPMTRPDRPGQIFYIPTEKSSRFTQQTGGQEYKPNGR